MPLHNHQAQADRKRISTLNTRSGKPGEPLADPTPAPSARGGFPTLLQARSEPLVIGKPGGSLIDRNRSRSAGRLGG